MPTNSSAAELRTRLERTLLDGRRKYTRLEVAAKAEVPPDRAQRLWRALGFPTAGDDEVVFTDTDVHAMRIADGLVRAGLVDADVEVSVTRALGLHLSRLAEWQTDMLRTLVDRVPELATNERRVVQLVERLLPELEQVQNFVWRRHLAAHVDRVLSTSDEEDLDDSQVVGFVDMVGYTRMTRQIDEAELSAVLEAFETLVTEVIAEHRGRVVKMIGDEVLYVADSTAEAAEIALTVAERSEENPALPSVRAGMAAGHVLSRFGDVYGPVVNLAARLTALARPGTVLVDQEFAVELAGNAAYVLRTRRPTAVRGYARIKPVTLRRARGWRATSE